MNRVKSHSTAQHSYYYALKNFVKKCMGSKNVERIRRVKSAIYAAKNDWRKKYTTQTEHEQKIYSVLMSVHMLEKALVMNNTKYLDAINYSNLLQNIADLMNLGLSANDFEIAGSIAVIKSALKALSGHEDSKSELDSLIAKYNIPENLFKGGCEKFTKSEILRKTGVNLCVLVILSGDSRIQ